MTAKPVLRSKSNDNPIAQQKEQNLRSLMQKMRSVLVAYSGGVDSTYLTLVATQELGEKAVCVTGISPSISEIQRRQALKIAKRHDFNHELIDTFEMDDPSYQANPADRCYFCKSELYGKLSEVAANRSLDYVLDGANADDQADHRPGTIAADENKVRSPLAEIGFTKREIRALSKEHDLETWEKPASPCLASRIQYGIPVSIERLSKVERGETILRDLGFVEFRVRIHEELVRIEISQSELEKVLKKETTDLLAELFRKLGFKYVTLDLQGFRSGAMNEVLKENAPKMIPKKC